VTTLKNLDPISKLTVLLAEDDIDDQELLKDAFLKINPSIQMVSFTSGKKFLHTLENLDTAPHMVILDYNIPEMNGAEILQHLNGHLQYKSMVKIVWSTSNSPFYKNSCLALGAHAYFVKPSTLAGLEQMAQEMLSFVGN
jgi:CheY-like chemotaxis protein